MKVSTRIFFCYLAISGLCLYYPFNWVLDTMRTRYLEGVEDPLVDQANIMASVAGLEMEEESFVPEQWYRVMQEVKDRRLSANIYNLTKEQVDIRIYITNREGIVIFDSFDPANVGSDYSQWRDVYYTLRGEYGARTTLGSSDDETSSVLYVAAPIMVNGSLAGVLTIGKPTTNISWFVENAKLQVILVAVLALLVASILSYLVSYWITRPIKRLTSYALAIRNGNRPSFPPLDKSEIGEMGEAFKKMQDALEGKRYVEQYIQNLTHEIKSPLSAIRGAAELLEEPMAPEQQRRFLSNINNETKRLQKVVERMLELSALENRRALIKIESVSISMLLKTVMERMEQHIGAKTLQVEVFCSDTLRINGDPFLLHQACANLIENGIDFSPENGRITVSVEDDDKWVSISIVDEGPGLADFAENRVFEKFFSLQRPDTGKKSTGLGLNFVEQVAALHQGSITLENNPESGVRALLKISRKLSFSEVVSQG